MYLFSDKDFQKTLDFTRMANPVVNSAKGSLLMLNHAGVPEAQEFYRRFKFNEDLTYEKNEIQKKLTQSFALMQKIRYTSINFYAKQLKIKNIVDLGCGFSPRGMFFKKFPEFKYIGIDLPAIINDLRIPGNDMTYIAADMTNLPSLEKALEKIEGKILFITEGVLQYFTENELKTVIQNISFLLNKYKGLWLTPDFNNNDYAAAILKPVFGQEQFEKIYTLLNSSKKTDVGTEFRKDEIASTTKGFELLKKSGFSVTQLGFLPENLDLISDKEFSAEVIKAIKENYNQIKHSLMYTKEDANGVAFNEGEVSAVHGDGNLSFRITETDISYGIFLKGRLDTISSPTLLSFFENSLIKKKDKTIIIDCAELEYVSSAGLRAFHIIYKSNNKNFKLVNCNSTVNEILEDTGFKEFFCL